MTARILDGRGLAASLRERLALRAAQFQSVHGRAATLAAVQVGDDPANLSYLNSKRRAAEKLGLTLQPILVPGDATTAYLVEIVARLNMDEDVDAILVEQPLPAGLDSLAIQAAIHPRKDADGVTPTSQGHLLGATPGPRPATPLAVMTILSEAAVPLDGAEAVVVGRSVVVGRPTALLLVAANATVTIAHSRSRNLDEITRRADVLVVAVGRAGLIGAKHVRPGAVVIDVGTNVVGEGDATRTVGDVDFDAVVEVAGAITPVPGGVGPVTTALVLQTTLDLAEAGSPFRPGLPDV